MIVVWRAWASVVTALFQGGGGGVVGIVPSRATLVMRCYREKLHECFSTAGCS
jgi:hypothetical protein